jgi:plastocyanin
MKRVTMTFLSITGWFLLGEMIMSSQVAKATTYNAKVGAETSDESVQADGFFPNELWILEGDSITWTFAPKNEIHTVTLLAQPPGAPEQTRPSAPPPAGPPFAVQGVNCTAAAATSYDGSVCASTQTGLTAPATFTVTFPKAGNYKLVCLVHTDMNGTVHVLSNNKTNSALLHNQQFYDQQGEQEANAILLDGDLLQFSSLFFAQSNAVLAGTGKIVATGGGTQYGAIVRFLNGTIFIHQGQSVTWTNVDPTEPHTVTFGTEPPGFVPPVPAGLSAPAGDGTLTATIKCSPAPAAACDSDFGPESNPAQVYNGAVFLNSGFLQAQAPDRTAPAAGSTQLPPGTTRITITFNKPGTYYYHCALHDVDGMLGEVVVLP